MEAYGQVTGDRRGGQRSRSRHSAALAAASIALLAAGLLLASPAGATDDGEDLSDLLVDDLGGYDLQPKGDPNQGMSGPIDWDDMGGIPGVGTDELPNEMATYVHTFVADDYETFALVMGLDIGDLPPSAVIAGAAVGMGQYGSGEEITLPDADRADVDYEARDMTDPGDPEGLTYSAAVMADDEIVVLVMVTSYAGDVAGEHHELDRFVTAQAAFEPPPEQTRSGGLDDEDEPAGQADQDDETAAGAADASPAAPAAADQPADGGGSNARRNGLLVAVGLLLIGLGLLIRYLVVYRVRPAAVPVAAPAPSPVVTPATWWPLAGGGPRPARTPLPLNPPTAPPTGPPLPAAGGPPLAPAAPPPRPAPPVASPAAHPPVPSGGIRAARQATDAAAADHGHDGWRLPG